MALAKIKTISDKLDMVQLEDNTNDKVLFVHKSQFPEGMKIVIGGTYSYRIYSTSDGRQTVHIYGRKRLPYSGLSIWTGSKGKATSNFNSISNRLRRLLSHH